MLLLVIGNGLREIGGEHEQFGRRFLGQARTARRYRLYSVQDTWAALIEDADGISVPGELVEISDERLGEELATEPDGIVLGPIELDDGRTVMGALGDAGVLRGQGVDITEHGGFAAYIRSRSR